MSTPLYERAMAYDYKDADTADLMRKVWDVTPHMTSCRTGSIGDGRYEEIAAWCRDRWGEEAWPIHGREGLWQFGGATIYGWTWVGFASAEMLEEFEAEWECRDEARGGGK